MPSARRSTRFGAMSGGVIAGIVGGVVLLILVIVGIYFATKKKGDSPSSSPSSKSGSSPSPAGDSGEDDSSAPAPEPEGTPAGVPASTPAMTTPQSLLSKYDVDPNGDYVGEDVTIFDSSNPEICAQRAEDFYNKYPGERDASNKFFVINTSSGANQCWLKKNKRGNRIGTGYRTTYTLKV
jgi:hypothetical protein